MADPAVRRQRARRELADPSASSPAERKRVLNVLAQRRYRQRRKEEQAKLRELYGLLATNQSGPDQGQITPSPSDELSLTTTRMIAMENVPPPRTPESLQFEMPLEPQTIDPSTSSSVLQQPVEEIFQEPIEEIFPEPDWSLGLSTPSNHRASLFDFDNFFRTDTTMADDAFADDRILHVPELDVLRASRSIALQIRSEDRIWDPSASSIFENGAALDWIHLLPHNLKPTTLQLTVAHHPVLDLLPWPRARSKLIGMYTLPPESWPRHPKDGTECSLFRLIHDLEDGSVRVWGEDPTTESAWEVDQEFVNAWWWMLDCDILRESDRRRYARGEPRLRVGLLR